jgi:hypothetical protein
VTDRLDTNDERTTMNTNTNLPAVGEDLHAAAESRLGSNYSTAEYLDALDAVTPTDKPVVMRSSGYEEWLQSRSESLLLMAAILEPTREQLTDALATADAEWTAAMIEKGRDDRPRAHSIPHSADRRTSRAPGSRGALR